MGTIKSFTDLYQSKVLSKILPLESADMYYPWYIEEDGDTVESGHRITTPNIGNFTTHKVNKMILPCWSLAALLNILAKQDFTIKSLERNNEYQYNIDIPSRHCKIWFSSLLDATFEMICWLKENNEL